MNKKAIIGISICAGVLTVVAATVVGFIAYTHKALEGLNVEKLTIDGSDIN